jgi:DNA-binding NarL/FixJ family response regulator
VTTAATDREELPGRVSAGRLPPAIRLLIVDGFPLMRAGLAMALDQAPIVVVGDADHGPDAVEQARSLAPDVVLIGLAGAGFGGPAGIADLRALLPQTRFVALGVDDDAGSVRAVLAAGACGYLSRRAGVDEIRRAIVAARDGDGSGRDTATGAGSRAGDPWPALSAREQQVLGLIVQGLTDREIGERLTISERTVHNHLERIREKTGLRRRAQLSGWATERRIAAEAPFSTEGGGGAGMADLHERPGEAA